MNKLKPILTFRIFLILIIITLSTIPSSFAWSWDTHSQIIDTVYQGLPVDVQKNLNLELMKNASNDPDEKFKDFTYHSYPKSYEKAKIWLDNGKTAYDKGDYSEASTDYGIASHYISDTFSAPHCVSKEASSDHTKYEKQGSKLKPTVTNQGGELKTLMENGYTQGGTSWNQWLGTKDTNIVQNNLNDATSVSLSAISNSINATTNSTTSTSNNILSSIYDFIMGLISGENN
ncbi:zinc dependent phospholipase C family protein [Methanobacterium sp.]|uniref:zinc dependent phospholipase C family protein n=1 Tax=Methanobacterium sp. TaxID=2164 RepID=UPI002AB84221|nr:zinc dependent phospholipase C family protein [Methanobacterium sp.]MDY9924309.1 zinc dependent phospholipase C family protein [Methanobacterium sp.]